MINVVAESDIAKIAENSHNASQKINGKIRRKILRVSLSIPCSRKIVFVTTQQTEKLSKKGVHGGVKHPHALLLCPVDTFVRSWGAAAAAPRAPARKRGKRGINPHIQKQAGTHFDPHLLDVFLEIIVDG